MAKTDTPETALQGTIVPSIEGKPSTKSLPNYPKRDTTSYT